MEIQGKVAIVTGSAKRVGKIIALALARRGAHVMVHYRTSEKEAQETVKQVRSLGVKSYAVKADLLSFSEAKKIVRKTFQYFGRVDIVVNSASIYEKTPFAKISERDLDAHLNVNLKSAFVISQEAAKIMLNQKCGKIINIIDSNIVRPRTNYLPYIVSKFGLIGLTITLAKELAPYIQVNAISPGPVMLSDHYSSKLRHAIIQATPLSCIGKPEDIANAVVFCIEGTDFMTGAVIPVDGGQHLL